MVASTWSASAAALTVEISTKEDSAVGAAFTFKAAVTEASGAVEYEWSFGDNMSADSAVGASQVNHTYSDQGRYFVVCKVRDAAGVFASATVNHVVHYPLTPKRPTSSTPIVYDAKRNRVFNVNQDNDTISAVDPKALKKVGELPVYKNPEALAFAPDGKLWVLHKDDYAIAIIDPDKFGIERGLRLPYASQPIGLAMSPTGDAAYVTLMATGKLLKLNPTTGETLAELDVVPRARGVAVSADGKSIWVTRFISEGEQGEVVRVDASPFKVAKRYTLAPDKTSMDGDQQGRGQANYLFNVTLSPDGREVWIPSNKDNVFRGDLRDGNHLTQDNTVRPMASIINLGQAGEPQEAAIDFDDRNLPSHVEFSPLGEYAFCTLTGSNMVEVRDTHSKVNLTALQNIGLAPRGSVLGPDNRLFVQASMSRSIVVVDVKSIVVDGATDGTKIADIPVVLKEKLPPQVLQGKQVFHNSSDGRMSVEGYLSCATCHFDGFEDGRVFDFTSRGEGLRNTTSLLGRRGTGQGRVHWSGNFDEIQDFETEIRELFNGHGFIADDALAMGTRKDPLGEKKAGLSKELDALAAYLTTLDHVNPSPFRKSDGTMTEDAEAGKELFGKLGCDFCHAGADFTDSARGLLHDVGTLKKSSGMRSGQPLLGIDTPTLRGVWETAPYLHDGSAPTLRDVLTSANSNDAHGFTSALMPKQIDQLVAYMQQIDNELTPTRLPFEPPPEPKSDGGTAPVPTEPAAKGFGKCSVSLDGIGGSSGARLPLSALLALLPLSAWYRRRQNRAAQELRLDAARAPRIGKKATTV